MKYKQRIGVSLGIMLMGVAGFSICIPKDTKFRRYANSVIEYRLGDQEILANLQGQSETLERTICSFADNYVFPSGAPFEEDKPYWENKVSQLEEISQQEDELRTSLEYDTFYQEETKSRHEAKRLAGWYRLGEIVSLCLTMGGFIGVGGNTLDLISERRKKKKELEQQ